MTRTCMAAISALGLLGLFPSLAPAADPIPADLSGFQAEHGLAAAVEGDLLTLSWPMEGGESGRIAVDLRPGAPLISNMGIRSGEAAPVAILEGVDPAIFVSVGTRVGEADRPAGMSPFNAFFDSPAKRPFETFKAAITPRSARVTRSGRVATILLDGLTAGPFSGDLRIVVYSGSRLVRVEAVAKTDRQDCAFLYDTGLVSAKPSWSSIAWTDTEGIFRREAIAGIGDDQAIAVRNRLIVAEAEGGSAACLPEPHRFFFARDLTDNLSNAWAGGNHRGLERRAGFGIRQPETGGGNFAPWYNAPPGTEQHLGIFYLLTRGKADSAIREALRYTRGDRFADLPGHVTFTSHWHMAVAEAAMKERARGGPKSTPDFVKMFKDINVNIVHLAEFHGDGHPGDPGPLRIPEMKAMFAECRRLSEGKLLFLPGEEANAPLGLPDRKVRAGHWLYLFPKPVYWIMGRKPGEPFSEDRPGLGRLYRVGDGREMALLLEQENGLAWTAHPRIKGSAWTPDAYKDEPFFKSDHWLGAAWKGMPVDLSRDRLGERGLDLLDDMSNWGDRKQLLGEVDVFKIDHKHELYAHMNVNFLKIDPRFVFLGGRVGRWDAILDALRRGQFFTTTGEILIHRFAVGGVSSGSRIPSGADVGPVVVELEWTFPMRLIEIISGDGARVYRERLDLADTGPFGRMHWPLSPDLRDRTWVRVEACDVAGNIAFSQPVWMGGAVRSPRLR